MTHTAEETPMRQETVHDAIETPTSVVTAEQQMPLALAIELMKDKGVHHLVVKDGADVVGVRSYRDVFDNGVQVTADGELRLGVGRTVGDVMVWLADHVDDETSLAEALELMQTHGCTALPVMNGNDLTGIVTQTDL